MPIFEFIRSTLQPAVLALLPLFLVACEPQSGSTATDGSPPVEPAATVVTEEVAGVDATADPAPDSGTELRFDPLTDEQKALYANRTEFFTLMPNSVRPDLDFRDVLSPELADAEPVSSQGFEELVIRDFFGDREGGVFADIGAYLPNKGSTTYYLEKRLGWTGVAVDVMEHYGKAWARERPDATFVHAAVSDKDGEVLELHVSGVFASLDKEVIEGWVGGVKKTIEVETSTLDSIFDEQGIEKVDFLSIDIEGAELGALAGFDIKRFRPDLVCIETRQYDAVRAYFEANGYEPIEKYLKVDKINLYFRPRAAE